MFTAYPTYNPYRVLYDRTDDGLPLLIGEDVYALQHALNFIVGSTLVTDGVLGPKTGAIIWAAQKLLGLEEDGRAGTLTQRALDLAILTALGVKKGSSLFRLGKGAFERESLFIMGNKSPQREDGTYDAGVVQRNTQFHLPEDGFNPVESIGLWRQIILDAHERYHDAERFRDTGYTYSDGKRRWKLAGGAWNAPAFANYYAGVKLDAVPGANGAVAFLDYCEGVGAYL
jgi:peptidoglycan hydrolase-like protein with peptidoglycan-binding domain